MNGAQKIRLLVAEDNAPLRDALQLLLDDQDGFLCVASTSSVQEIVPLCKRHQVGVVVLDIDLRGESSLRALPIMRTALPAVRFIIFSGHNHPEMIRGALEAGASAYVTKATHTDKLIARIREFGVRGGPLVHN
jgi:two-component system response regulator DesR